MFVLEDELFSLNTIFTSLVRRFFDRYSLMKIEFFSSVPPYFIDDHSSIQQRAVVEGSTLQLSCSAQGRPQPSITWFYRSRQNKHIQRKPFLSWWKEKTERFRFSSVSDDRGCHDIICELHLGNYTRHDPSIIECIADNGKSSRISKVFHIDVFCKSSEDDDEQTNWVVFQILHNWLHTFERWRVFKRSIFFSNVQHLEILCPSSLG